MLILTSSQGGISKKRNAWKSSSFLNSNGFLDFLQKNWKPYSKILVVCAASKETNHNDNMIQLLKRVLQKSQLQFSSLTMCDCRNPEIVSEIDLFDVIFLSGGHVPSQNAFMKSINLEGVLHDYSGTIIGISAGAMNASKCVYALPELPGEAINRDYSRFLSGLSLTPLTIIPHFDTMNNAVLDGMRILNDIVLPDSYNNVFYAIPDGSYIVSDCGRAELRGKGYVISNGEIVQICRDGGTAQII